MQNKIQAKIIVFLGTLPWDFPLDYQRELAMHLNKQCDVIYFGPYDNPISIYKDIWNIKKLNDLFMSFRSYFQSLTYVLPFAVVPFGRFPKIARINKTIMENILRVLIFFKSFGKTSYLYADYPLPADTYRYVRTRFMLYDCMEYPFVGKTPSDIRSAKSNHQTLIRKADMVFVNSEAIKKICLPSVYGSKIRMISSGFVLNKYFSNMRKRSPNGSMKSIPKPIAGFVGFTFVRLDIDLLYQVVLDNPAVSFVFIGPVKTEFIKYSNTSDGYTAYFYDRWKSFSRLPNVFVLNAVSRNHMASCIKFIDVGIIPYDTRQMPVLYANAIKGYEFVMMGKRIVSTNLLPLANLKKYVVFASTPKEFSRSLQKQLNKPMKKHDAAEMKKTAMWHDVGHKASQIHLYLDALATSAATQ